MRYLENILGYTPDIKILIEKKIKTRAEVYNAVNLSTQGQGRQAPVLDQGLLKCIFILTLFECNKQ